MTLRLVIFDVDGTLVDSQADILASMEAGFGSLGLPVPSRKEVLGVVGLSLPQAMAALAPDQSAENRAEMVTAYKDSYAALRVSKGAESSPLYPGVHDMLEHLAGIDDVLLGVATGKSRRGLNALMELHDLGRFFITQQCADDHPSKPHPSMLMQAMRDAGVGAAQSVMIGDTSFDIEMANAAKMASIGVSWGYHSAARLSEASVVVDRARQLPEAIDQIHKGLT